MFQTVGPNCRRFLESSSLPCVKYICDESAGTAIRLIWALLVGISMCTGITFIMQEYKFWEENPILVVVDTFSQPIRGIQYPTLTICPMKQFDRWAAVDEVLGAVDFSCIGADCPDFELLEGLFSRTMAEVHKMVGTLYKKVKEENRFTVSGVLLNRTANFIADLERINASLVQELELRIRSSYFKNKKTLLSDLGIEDLFASIDDESPDNAPEDHYELSKELAFYLFAFVPVTNFAKFLEHELPSLIGRSFSNLFNVEAMDYYVNGYEFSAAEYEVQDSFAKIFRWLTGSVDANVSLFEVPGILQRNRFSPSSMFAMPSEYQYWYSAEKAVSGWDREHNFFGQLLSEHKSTVLRAMLASAYALTNADTYSFTLPYIRGDFVPVNKYGRRDLSGIPKYIPVATFCRTCWDHWQRREVLFQPVLTHHGVCSSYNPIPVHDVFAPNGSTLLRLLEKNATDPAHIKSAGEYSKLTLYLDFNRAQHYPMVGPYFRLSIQNNRDFVDTLSNSIDINTGFRYQVQVTPVQHVTSEDFRDLPISVRQCRYLDENALGNASLFRFYTRKTCEYECMIRLGVSQVGCLPWFYPAEDDSHDLCDGFQTNTFKKQTSLDLHQNCECLPDCEQLEFHHSLTAEAMNAEVECDDEVSTMQWATNFRSLANRRLTSDINSNMNHLTMEDLKEGKNLTINATTTKKLGVLYYDFLQMVASSKCRNAVHNDLAEVTVEITEPSMTRIRMQKRATFADKLGTLGTSLVG